jgi:DNA polymerase
MFPLGLEGLSVSEWVSLAGIRMRSDSETKAKKQRRVPGGVTNPPIRSVPEARTMAEVRQEAAHCTACDLWKNATQTVFGEGALNAAIMFVGEQPGDQEDRAGRPFVGPAGKLLDKALEEAGIDRSAVYVTNAVKHFKWEPAARGKRRIHKKPRYLEIQACRSWLDSELQLVQPKVLVALGATAAQALFGREFSVMRQRGQPIETSLAPIAVATVHPSSILRAPDDVARQQQMGEFIKDLKAIAKLAAQAQAA